MQTDSPATAPPKHPGKVRVIDRTTGTDVKVNVSVIEPHLRFAQCRGDWTPITTIVSYDGGFHACGSDNQVVLWSDAVGPHLVLLGDGLTTESRRFPRFPAKFLKNLAQRAPFFRNFAGSGGRVGGTRVGS